MIVDATKWQTRFIELAEHISLWSKDPSTKCGALVVDRDNRVVGMGYNGFPARVHDHCDRYGDREKKYQMVVHAELNAVLAAMQHGHLRGADLYVHPFLPCSECAKAIIQSRAITTVYARWAEPSSPLRKRWKKSNDLALTMFAEAGILVRELMVYDRA